MKQCVNACAQKISLTLYISVFVISNEPSIGIYFFGNTECLEEEFQKADSFRQKK